MAKRGKSSRRRKGRRPKAYYDHHGRKMRFLKEDDRFSFECDLCGRCCQGPTIPLNLYDILKISSYYGMKLSDFLEDFTSWVVPAASGIPTVLLRTDPSCVFNKEGRCNIYQVRPFLCRSYPAIRIVSYNPSADEINVKYSLVKNCSAIEAKETQTIREWLIDQCGNEYLEKSLRWSEFVVRLAGGKYPKDDKVFHRLFYSIVYSSEPSEDEIEDTGISESSSPEERFESRIRFASSLEWTRITEEERENGAVFYIKHSDDLHNTGRSVDRD